MTYPSKISSAEIITENDKINHKVKEFGATKEFDAAERLTHYFIEGWNDINPTERLNPKMIDLIQEHIRYAYVAGYDDYRLIVERAISKSINESQTKISVYKFNKQILQFRKEISAI